MVSAMQDWRRGTLDVSGGRLAYHRTGGDGPKLVLSHGLTDNGLCWARLATALAPQFDVIMLDARGHGESSRIADGPHHDTGRDIAEAIGALGLVAPAVIGHSVGARAAALCAGTYPDLVSKAILEDPPFLPLADSPTAEKRRGDFRRHVEKFRAMSDAQITAAGKAQSPDWHEDDFHAWAASKKQVDPAAMPEYNLPWQDSVARIMAPTLLIHGDQARGGIVSPEIAEEAQRINPRISVVQIRGAGHNIRRESFSEYLSAVQAFLTAP